MELLAPALLEGESDSRGELAPGGDRDLPAAPAPAVEKVPDETAGRQSLRALPQIDYKTFGDSGQKVPKDIPDEDAHDEDAHDEAHCMCLLTLHGTETVHEPRTLKEAEASPEWPEWKRAMDDEITQLQKLGTYKPADLPQGRKAIGCRRPHRTLQGPPSCAGILAGTRTRLFRHVRAGHPHGLAPIAARHCS